MIEMIKVKKNTKIHPNQLIFLKLQLSKLLKKLIYIEYIFQWIIMLG